MMRAVRQVGSDDYSDIYDQYRSRTFGFASSNFFTCLLAALQVERDAERYFGKIDRDPPLKAYEAPIDDFISLRELARFLRLDTRKIAALNPGLADGVLRGRRLIPAGYRLRLPLRTRADPDREARVFLAGYRKIPAMFKQSDKDAPIYGTGSRKRPKRK
jgi:membrane-bound lytic murein transglycosylase D